MKILIVEDEAAAVRRLYRLIETLSGHHIIVGALDSVEATIQWLAHNDYPDVILLDINLSDGSSFTIMEHCEVKCPVIFVTAFDEYAVKAFRVNAIDYLLKPVKRAELEQAFNRLQTTPSEGAYFELIQTLHADGFIKKDNRVLVKIGQSIKLIDLDAVAYYFTKDKITFAVMPNSRKYPVEHSLERLMGVLDSRCYFQINRQYIISVNAIQSMYSFSKSRVKINLAPQSQDDIIVSTERSPRFKKWLTGQL